MREKGKEREKEREREREGEREIHRIKFDPFINSFTDIRLIDQKIKEFIDRVNC